MDEKPTLNTAHHRKMRVVRVAERMRLSPVTLAVVSGLAISALTLLVERYTGPTDYVRKGFEISVFSSSFPTDAK